MPHTHSRHNAKNDWHVRCVSDLWKVYDRDQKYRCSFRTRAEADAYIDQHIQRRTTSTRQQALLDA